MTFSRVATFALIKVIHNSASSAEIASGQNHARPPIVVAYGKLPLALPRESAL